MTITSGEKLARESLKRCGIIPYLIHNDIIYFLLARHQETGELGDFGGGIRKNEFALDGALRELGEESKYIFGTILADELGTKVALREDDKMGVIFMPLTKEWFQKATKEFERRRIEESASATKRKASDEISELVWVSETELKRMIYDTRRPSPPSSTSWGSTRNMYSDRARTAQNDRTNDRTNVLWRKVQAFFQHTYDVRGMADRLRLIYYNRCFN